MLAIGVLHQHRLPYLGKKDVKNLQPNCFGRCTTLASSHQPSKAPPMMQGKQVSKISQVSKIEVHVFNVIPMHPK